MNITNKLEEKALVSSNNNVKSITKLDMSIINQRIITQALKNPSDGRVLDIFRKFNDKEEVINNLYKESTSNVLSIYKESTTKVNLIGLLNIFLYYKIMKIFFSS